MFVILTPASVVRLPHVTVSFSNLTPAVLEGRRPTTAPITFAFWKTVNIQKKHTCFQCQNVAEINSWSVMNKNTALNFFSFTLMVQVASKMKATIALSFKSGKEQSNTFRDGISFLHLVKIISVTFGSSSLSQLPTSKIPPRDT